MHKNAESIAYRAGLERLTLQNFVGAAAWDDADPRAELARQIGTQLGDPGGALVFDPSGFPKSGRQSVGLARQRCGRLGKTDNFQVAVFMGHVSRHEHALVDAELHLPKEWTKDRGRMKKADVPAGTKFRTRHELALELLARHGAALPHGWIAGDDEIGRPAWFRQELRGLGERYPLAVPNNASVRDLDAEAPAGSGVGRPPQRPWTSVAKWAAAQPESAWIKLDVRDGSKGPLQVELLKRRVRTRDEGSARTTNCWWRCAAATATTERRAKSITIFRTRRPTRRRPNWPAPPRRNTASRNACAAARAKRAWPTTKCGTGSVGNIA